MHTEVSSCYVAGQVFLAINSKFMGLNEREKEGRQPHDKLRYRQSYYCIINERFMYSMSFSCFQSALGILDFLSTGLLSPRVLIKETVYIGK